MSTPTEDLLRQLHIRGQINRDRQWQAYEVTLGHLMTLLEAQEHFNANFGHLVPQQPQPIQADAPRPAQTEPPPLPQNEEAYLSEHERKLKIWEEAIGKQHPSRNGGAF